MEFFQGPMTDARRSHRLASHRKRRRKPTSVGRSSRRKNCGCWIPRRRNSSNGRRSPRGFLSSSSSGHLSSSRDEDSFQTSTKLRRLCTSPCYSPMFYTKDRIQPTNSGSALTALSSTTCSLFGADNFVSDLPTAICVDSSIILSPFTAVSNGADDKSSHHGTNTFTAVSNGEGEKSGHHGTNRLSLFKESLSLTSELVNSTASYLQLSPGGFSEGISPSLPENDPESSIPGITSDYLWESQSYAQSFVQDVNPVYSIEIEELNSKHDVCSVFLDSPSSNTVDEGLCPSSLYCLDENYEAIGHKHTTTDIPSPPHQMLNQIELNDTWCCIERIVHHSEKKLENVVDEEMLVNLLDREHLIPLAWGYLDRSSSTGIYEPHRYLVVIWQIQHASMHGFQLETLVRAVNLLDHCLFGSGTTYTIYHDVLWILAAACLSIAAKLEETQCSRIIPELQESCKEVGDPGCFTTDQLVWMETSVLQMIRYQCSTPTAATFIWYFLPSLDGDHDGEIKRLALSLLCLCITDYEMLQFRPSIVAASSVFLACLMLNQLLPIELIQRWTRVTSDTMKTCIKRLDFLVTSSSGP